ncbi:unnamed protein product [Paramecium pentaurelia]|uniref:Uncharacterized protein n=1 Tax=Paramecium pentaurelia TaxID=43138 RepID=A0A8S1UCR0_9CILI|nr:unnamed protein product [Paramecium pentaurelia]
MHYKKTSNGDQFTFLNNRVNELMTQVEKLELIIQQQKKEISYLVTAPLNDENNYLKEKIKLLEQENTSQMEYYEEIILQHQMRNQEYAIKVKEEQNSFQLQIDQLEMKIQIILEHNDKLQEQINQRDNIELQQKYSKLIQDHNQIQSNFEILNKDYQLLKQEKDKQDQELWLLKNQNAQLKTQSIYQQEQSNQKDLECSQLVNELSYLQNQLHTQIQQNKDLKKYNDDKSVIIDQLTKQLLELNQYLIDHKFISQQQ